ncbi:hypothetical protein TST_1749 [Thermosulfidibacter takaii ABI70S6]|uniref:Leucine-binding protein domain-containing protein n=1 Tax=Thermosulfidibacter takaii (strain DSM 17441 / JCM 13301 / NBRC 103674 / ABI70S6) TaxID=1298851 RepID=A0A0S3QW57_THET7|nr:hypothetical protein [Thermosulfidibacter takaii]BAT72533.1 hypothetical protein TST_1749 [Thermosulfidibacter takaii ABI70S6]
MKRFTAILLSISLLFLATSHSYAVTVCFPAGATQEQLEELNGIELAFKEHKITLSREIGCKDVLIKLSENKTIAVSSLLPTLQEEAEQVLSLIKGDKIAIVYDNSYQELEDVVVNKLLETNLQPILTYSFPKEKNNFMDLLQLLIDLKENKKETISTVIFIGTYRKAILIMPLLRIFRPFPKVVATWRIYDPLMFAYNSFMETTEYYEWFPSWLPLLNIREFVVKYLSYYKTLPSRFAALGYDAATIALRASEEGKSLQDVRMLGVTGLKGIDKTGLPPRSYYLVDIKALPQLPPPVATR